MLLKVAILRKIAKADKAKVDKVMDTYRKNNPGTQYMSDPAAKVYMRRRAHLDSYKKKQVELRDAYAAGKVSKEDYWKQVSQLNDVIARQTKSIQSFETERTRRKKHNLTEGQLNQEFQLKSKAQNAGAKAFADTKQRALAEGKSEELAQIEANEASKAAASGVVRSHIEGSGKVDAFLSGGSRADQAARAGQYMQSLPKDQIVRSNIDPETQKRIQQMDPRYKWGQRLKWLGSAGDVAHGVVSPLTFAKKYWEGAQDVVGFRPLAENYVANKTQQATKQRLDQADKDYASEIQTAPEKYRKERGQQVGAMVGKYAPWALALGAGGLALMAMMRNRQQPAAAAAAPAATAQTAQVSDWRSERSRGHGAFQAAGAPQQVNPGRFGGMLPSFTNFMNRKTS